MSGSHDNVNYKPLREGNQDAFDAAMLDGIDFLDDTNLQVDDDDDTNDSLVEGKVNVDEEAELEGKRESNEATSTQSMSIAAVRQRNSRDTKKKLHQSWHDRIKDLEEHLKFLKEKKAERKERVDNYILAVAVAQSHIESAQRKNKRLKMTVQGREEIKSFLFNWVLTQFPQKSIQGRPCPIETTLLPDDNGRKNGSIHMTNRGLQMSKQFYPDEAFKSAVKDDIKVKVHVGDDGDGTCIHAIEYHLQFTIFANFENVAKTWWFDLSESTPLLRSRVSARLPPSNGLSCRRLSKNFEIILCTSCKKTVITSTDG
ncbi:hypothetical protein AC1031_016790 [Aphanomyces cochlioides]|nr:hypothetical protein AC1031_016790 [Aphanomyces cochlioides]